MKKMKSIAILGLAFTLLVGGVLTGCGSKEASSDEKVILYTNADDEAIAAMQNALDSNGYKDKYIVQTFGTSELGGKLLAEGADIEADLITMSSFYVESAEDEHHMFKDLEFDTGALEEYPSYYTPITAQEGAIIYNTDVLEENNLPVPTSIKDLADPVYKDMISVTDIQSSSTAYLCVQVRYQLHACRCNSGNPDCTGAGRDHQQVAVQEQLRCMGKLSDHFRQYFHHGRHPCGQAHPQCICQQCGSDQVRYL